MKADTQTEAAVQATFEQTRRAYEQRDMARLLELFAPDPDLVMYGTGADEKRLGLAQVQAQAQRDWAQTEAASFEWSWTSISSAGSVAWVAADVIGHARVSGQEVQFPLRLTGVLERRGERWLWVQWHFSVAAAGQAEGESIPAVE
jgi:ketosteroid isomerase-like protein